MIVSAEVVYHDASEGWYVSISVSSMKDGRPIGRGMSIGSHGYTKQTAFIALGLACKCMVEAGAQPRIVRWLSDGGAAMVYAYGVFFRRELHHGA